MEEAMEGNERRLHIEQRLARWRADLQKSVITAVTIVSSILLVLYFLPHEASRYVLFAVWAFAVALLGFCCLQILNLFTTNPH